MLTFEIANVKSSHHKRPQTFETLMIVRPNVRNKEIFRPFVSFCLHSKTFYFGFINTNRPKALRRYAFLPNLTYFHGVFFLTLAFG